jgi:F-type H+-transporting ATPase subunit alpha
VYVTVGASPAAARDAVRQLRSQRALRGSTAGVAAPSADAPAAQFLAPFAGLAIAEGLRDSGRHALLAVVLRHAPVIQAPNVAPSGVEVHPGGFGGVVEGFRAALGDGVAGVLAAQLTHQRDELVAALG